MNLFDYSSYRSYLRCYLLQLPKKGRGALTKISVELNINATFLSQVLSGSRDFTHEQAYELAQYLKLSELETDYFTDLVLYERAGTHLLKKHLKHRLAKLKKEAQKLSQNVAYEKSLSDTERAQFYSSWLYSAIHLFSSTNSNGVSLNAIAAHFKISKVRAQEIVDFLINSGLCQSTENRITMGIQSTFIEHGSPYLNKHHSNWRIKAIEKSETLSEEELMFTGQMSISKEDFVSLKAQLTEFLKEISEQVKKSKAEGLAVLNIDWFWID